MFVLGIFLINFPMLSVFNKSIFVFGIPLIFFYTFLLWAIIIFMTFRLSKSNIDMDAGIVIIVSLIYLILLFGVAIFGNKMSKSGNSIVNNPYVYSLSLAVYCTVWTFYGSVGRAADTGLGYVPVYLGLTIMAPIWYMVMRKIILISKQLRVTSIADFCHPDMAKVHLSVLLQQLF